MKSSFAFFLLLASAAHAADVPKFDPTKPVEVALTLAQWRAVLACIADSERISARDANRIAQSIMVQVQVEVQASQAPKK